MEEEVPRSIEPIVTLENIGKGIAFMGMAIFVIFAMLFMMSIAQPEYFSLFSGPEKFVGISVISIIMVIGGYMLTKYRPEPVPDE